MPDEFGNIDATIADLEARIAAMQEALGALRKAKDALGLVGIATSGSGGGRGTADIEVDQFVGMSIVDAAREYLRLVGRPARATSEIIEGLGRGGLQRVSPDSVTTLLTRSHNGDGPIVRAQKGYWGLAEWYGKRPPKMGRTVKDVVEDAITRGDTTAEEIIDDAVEAHDQQKEIDEMIEHDKTRKEGRTPVK